MMTHLEVLQVRVRQGHLLNGNERVNIHYAQSGDVVVEEQGDHHDDTEKQNSTLRHKYDSSFGRSNRMSENARFLAKKTLQNDRQDFGF